MAPNKPSSGPRGKNMEHYNCWYNLNYMPLNYGDWTSA